MRRMEMSFSYLKFECGVARQFSVNPFSAIYSTKEIWLMSMRSWSNGTLNIDPLTNLPPLNTVGAPIANPAPSHLNKFLDPSRLFREKTFFLRQNLQAV